MIRAAGSQQARLLLRNRRLALQSEFSNDQVENSAAFKMAAEPTRRSDQSILRWRFAVCELVYIHAKHFLACMLLLGTKPTWQQSLMMSACGAVDAPPPGTQVPRISGAVRAPKIWRSYSSKQSRQSDWTGSRVDAGGQMVIRRQLNRRYVLAFFEKLRPCLVGIEDCASSHYWSRKLQTLGHTVRLQSATFAPDPSERHASRLGFAVLVKPSCALGRHATAGIHLRSGGGIGMPGGGAGAPLSRRARCCAWSPVKIGRARQRRCWLRMNWALILS
jgi:hypothetical protein